MDILYLKRITSASNFYFQMLMFKFFVYMNHIIDHIQNQSDIYIYIHTQKCLRVHSFLRTSNVHVVIR